MRQLSPEHRINTGEHQFQLSPRQLTDAFSELAAVDGDNKRDIRNRVLGKACRSCRQQHITGRVRPLQVAR